MKYKIVIDYRTGDSFNTNYCVENLEIEWNNIDMAKESLSRIKNHYEYYGKNSSLYRKPDEDTPKGVAWDDEYRMIMLELVDDDGKPYLYSSFWTGYFESLHSAKIIFDDNDLVYEPY